MLIITIFLSIPLLNMIMNITKTYDEMDCLVFPKNFLI